MVIVSVDVGPPLPRTLSGSVRVVAAGVAALAVSVTDTVGLKGVEAPPALLVPAVTVPPVVGVLQ
jgi:hypothetical protein